MAGGRMKYRHLGVTSSHRQALLRNLVTSLIEHESITTTYAKAKEAQRFAEKLITLGKRNTEAAQNRVKGILFRHELMPKVFGTLRERYATRPGGYTRVLRCESHKEDQAQSAILELVDGPRDMRFMMTAKTLVNERASNKAMHDITEKNVEKVTRFRPGGLNELEQMVQKLESRSTTVDEVLYEPEDPAGTEQKGGSDQKPRTNREAYESRRKAGEKKDQVYIPYTLEKRGQRLTFKEVKERRQQRLDRWNAEQAKSKE